MLINPLITYSTAPSAIKSHIATCFDQSVWQSSGRHMKRTKGFFVLGTGLQRIPMVARSKALFCGHWLAGIPGDTAVCSECCVLLGSRLCDGPIARPEESFQVPVRACARARACVCVCVCEY